MMCPVSTRIDQIVNLAAKRMRKVRDPGGMSAPVDYLNAAERGELYDLEQRLPTYAERRVQSRLNVLARILARNTGRLSEAKLAEISGEMTTLREILADIREEMATLNEGLAE